jgi:hypothetical protein
MEMKNQLFKVSNLFALVIALMVSSYATVTIAQNKLTWDKLGTKVVDYTIDHDVFSLDKKDAYTALKIVVNNGTVNIHKATVHFTGGGSQDIKLPDELTKGNDGKVIDLNGNKRVIEKVTFWYDTKNSDKSKAVVEVWARKI